jgi:hydroxyacylglutathione hydrolase
MFVETLPSPGLSHRSYIVGDGTEAAVIDPRRDVEAYLEVARRRGCRITHVLETHRNEDLVSGAPILAERTGATVHHGPHAAGDVSYARTIREGEHVMVGSARLEVLETPGHTDDSVSYVLVDEDHPDGAVAVFTGDALFVGDVGRTDFYPDREREVAGLLWDSLTKLMGLGDGVRLYPAHGKGSVCGGGLADRDVSTLGHERRNNPRLQLADREAFIEAKLAENHQQPPYFREMERLNLEGAPPLAETTPVPPWTGSEPGTGGPLWVDVRRPAAFLGAHVPGSLALPLSVLSSWAGWFLVPETPVVLVADDAEQAHDAALRLGRMGFDGVQGAVMDSLAARAAEGRPFASLPAVDADTVAERLTAPPEGWTLLDVRKPDEVAQGRIAGSTARPLSTLPDDLEGLDREAPLTVLCGSGVRATVAASILERAGFTSVDVFLGSMGAWQARGGPVEIG